MDYFEDREGLRHDIKELDPRLRKIFKEAEQEAIQELSKKLNIRSSKKTYCYAFWNEKKRVLKERYSIDWKTLAELNPEVFGVLVKV